MPGILGFTSVPQKSDNIVLERMISSILHYSGYSVLYQRTALGQFACVHLNLFDHSVFATTPDGRVGLLLDGWIWDLPRDSGQEATICDSDAAAYCLAYYLSHGIDFVRELNGEFNIALWDQREGAVYLCNDRYGLRPLQYSQAGNAFFFAPEGKAIMAGSGITPKLDMTMVVNWLSLGRALLGKRTFFQDIYVLPPASILRWKDGRYTLTHYWDYVYRPLPSIDDDFVGELVRAFQQAVRRRVRPGYRYAVTLSGGLDSRVVASVLATTTQKTAVACTFGMPESDEVTLAHAVASELGMPWTHVKLEPADFIRHATEGVRLTEGLDLCVQSYGLVVYPELRQKASVAFTGLALDLPLGGSYMDAQLLDADMDSEKALALVQRKLRYFNDDTLCMLFDTEQIVQVVEDLLKDVWEPDLMKTNWADHADRFALHYRVNRMTFTRQTWQRLFLEDAAPTFDNDFIDLILQIPAHERLGHRIYQRFMQRLCPELMHIPYQRTLLPPSVPIEFWTGGVHLEAQREALYTRIWQATDGQVYIPYKRYSTNYEEWLRTDQGWISWSEDLLMGKDCRLGQIGLNPNVFRRLLKEHRIGAQNHRQRLLQLFTLELLLRSFFG